MRRYNSVSFCSSHQDSLLLEQCLKASLQDFSRSCTRIIPAYTSGQSEDWLVGDSAMESVVVDWWPLTATALTTLWCRSAEEDRLLGARWFDNVRSCTHVGHLKRHSAEPIWSSWALVIGRGWSSDAQQDVHFTGWASRSRNASHHEGRFHGWRWCPVFDKPNGCRFNNFFSVILFFSR